MYVEIIAIVLQQFTFLKYYVQLACKHTINLIICWIGSSPDSIRYIGTTTKRFSTKMIYNRCWDPEFKVRSSWVGKLPTLFSVYGMEERESFIEQVSRTFHAKQDLRYFKLLFTLWNWTQRNTSSVRQFRT